MSYVIPYIAIGFLLLLNIFFAAALLRARRRSSRSDDASTKTRQSTQRTLIEELRLLLGHLDHDENLREWGQKICNLTQTGFKADCAFVLQAVSTGKHERRHRILWGAGNSSWCIPQPGFEIAFDTEIGKHFFWSDQAQILSENDLADCLPTERARGYSSALAGSIEINRHHAYLVLLRDHDAENYESPDKMKFELCFQMIKAGFTMICLHEKTLELEKDIHRAHEEGMLQISTGIIHNIGNGIAVIKIALDQLNDFKSLTELTRFLNGELVPAMLTLENDGSPDRSDQQHQYLEAIREIGGKIETIITDHTRELDFICDKFQNVIEIITLQQQFIGELGTENVVPFRLLLADVVKMSENPLRESDIEFKKAILAEEKVLVDPALMKQVLLTIIKYSVHSINKIHRNPSTLELVCKDFVSEEEKRKYIRLEIRDNGYGIQFDPDAVFKDHSQQAQEHRELMFCKGKIEKYRGTFEIEAHYGTGSTVHVELPVYDPEKDSAPSE